MGKSKDLLNEDEIGRLKSVVLTSYKPVTVRRLGKIFNRTRPTIKKSLKAHNLKQLMENGKIVENTPPVLNKREKKKALKAEIKGSPAIEPASVDDLEIEPRKKI